MDSTHDYRERFVQAFGLATPGSDAITLPFIGKTLLVMANDTIPGRTVLQPLGRPLHHLKIGTIGGVVCEIQQWSAQAELPVGMVRADQRKLLSIWPQSFSEAVSRGKQLAVWLHENQFCGVCGGKLETSSLMPVRSCEACGFTAFPRISPVCIVLIARKDEILLARSAHFTPGIYSVLAGFVEAGESVEDCVHREVEEEVGIKVHNLRWFGSQSWPFPHSLMLGFLADYAGGALVLQEDEIEDAQWFRRDNLPALPQPWTIAYRMIRSWLSRENT